MVKLLCQRSKGDLARIRGKVSAELPWGRAMRDHSQLSKKDEKHFRGKRLLRNMVNEALLLNVGHDTGEEIPTLEPLSRHYNIHDPNVFTC